MAYQGIDGASPSSSKVIAPRYSFVEPTSIRQCKERLYDLLCTIEKINVDLSDPARTDREGRVLTRSEYKSWRHRALAKLSKTRVEYRYLSDWVLDKRRSLLAAQVGVENPDDPSCLIHRGRDMLRRLAEHDAEAGRLSDVFDQYLSHV